MVAEQGFFLCPPPDIAKVLVPCAAAALVPAEATCVLYKLSVVTCAVVPLQIICAVQSGVFECCVTDHVYRQKLLPTETFSDKNLCLMLYSGTSQRHKERHKKIDRHGNIACALFHCGTCAAGGGGHKKNPVAEFILSLYIFKISILPATKKTKMALIWVWPY